MQDNISKSTMDKNLQEQFAEKFAAYPVEVFIQDNLKSAIDVDVHWHDCIEILYMIEGSAPQQVNSETFTLNKNDVIILHERNIHSTFCEENQDVKILVIKFSSSHLSGFNSGIIQSRYINAFINAGHTAPYVLTKCADNRNVFRETMMSLYHEYSNKETAYELYVNGYMAMIEACNKLRC